MPRIIARSKLAPPAAESPVNGTSAPMAIVSPDLGPGPEHPARHAAAIAMRGKRPHWAAKGGMGVSGQFTSGAADTQALEVLLVLLDVLGSDDVLAGAEDVACRVQP